MYVFISAVRNSTEEFANDNFGNVFPWIFKAQKSKRKVTKIISLVKLAENLVCTRSSLMESIRFQGS